LKQTLNHHNRLRAFIAGVTLSLALSCSGGRAPAATRWRLIELSFEGPASQGAGTPNPFAIPFDVIFTDPGGKSYRVPGFYDGDGKGGINGTIWKIRFSADSNGAWAYRTESTQAELDGRQGTFEVKDPPPDAPEFYRNGRLEYVGDRYLKFRDGGYWIKFGADEPENILGGAFSHEWEAKKKQIDYLASMTINSIYVMTHNLEGDQNDVWPWLGTTPDEAKANDGRFDVARLERWRDFFEYVQSKGIVIQLVLEDDSAWSGYDHARYYREIVARFGYLPALCFNFGEEYNENYSLAEALGYVKLLARIDPYNHPRAIHNVNRPVEEYVDSPDVQVTSIQTPPRKPESLDEIAVEWFEACLVRNGRPLVVSFDEGRPALDRRSWWSVYLGGGMWESLARVPGGYAEAENVWRELAAARVFMKSLPFQKMHPTNFLVTKGKAFCLAQPGEAYALYLPEGGTVEVDLTAGNRYGVEWFDPRGRGEVWRRSSAVSGGRQLLTPPGEGDWAVRITRTEGDAESPPTAVSAKVFTKGGQPVSIHLATLPGIRDGAQYEIIQPPEHGTLSGKGATRTYTPQTGFTGADLFRWRASTGSIVSNAARVSIISSATGVNSPPKALGQTVHVEAGQPQSFILRYTDPDGPGPYQVRVATPPIHGTTEGLDNDITYTPTPGFKGEDSLTWWVSDGQDRSNRATVRLIVR
jgi:hypothetical protein